jgi:adenylate cyclase
MTSLLNSLQTKLTVAFVILILLIAGLTFFYTYGQTKDALKESVRDELAQVAGVMSTQVSGDAVLALKPGDEGTPAFKELQDKLLKLRSQSTITKNAYIMKLSGTGIVFVVDDIYGTDADAATIGEVYDSPDRQQILAAFSSPTASNDFYTDRWGTFISGYAPVLDSTGKAVAVLGVDMDASAVIARQDFIGYTIYLILAIAVLIAGIIILFFSRTLIRDIKSLNDAATKISMGDMTAMVEVERNDEIGDLARSFSRMVASLKIMMGTGDEGQQ